MKRLYYNIPSALIDGFFNPSCTMDHWRGQGWMMLEITNPIDEI